MKIETFHDLIEWTRQPHAHLAECLKHCATQQEEARAKWLLEYLADHEATLEQTIAGFEKQADPKALHTWVYDYLAHAPIAPHQACRSPYAEMSFDDICGEIFALHDQVIELYRYLEGRAEIPDARDLVRELLKLEEHEAMRLAHQTNRARDM
ncbi:ATPase [Halomonas sp. TRM85114]|uniref:ATPase n=1 Tax=Halomonas jincaotanensis TaxID=2810616 RepID=UPI001BD6D9D8|nr:ATPase [Halomonas jincaotanensis]MBS9405335.1 ATPase [Halomonas jincaotanensis]